MASDSLTTLLEPVQEASPLASRPLSRRLSSFELKGIHAALNAVGEESQRMQEVEGFSQASFFLGVLNVPFVCFVLAWYPQHFWLLYCAECLFLIPLWFLQMRRVFQGALFILDFCWVCNLASAVGLLLVAFGVLTVDRAMFLCFSATALGPLAWACIVLHNGLVFHSIERIASLTIHFLPLLVVLTLTHDNARVLEAWPGRFPTASELSDATFAELVVRGLLVYLAWWLPYSIWLLLDGVSQPGRGRRTVYGELHRKGLGNKIKAHTGFAGERSQACVYLVGHLLAVSLSLVWPPLCMRWVTLHGAFGLAVLAIAAWNGAGYYEFLMARRYTKVVQGLVEQRESARRRTG